MCYQSPARILRNVKRITNFLKKKNIGDTTQPKVKPTLSIEVLPPISIPPSPKMLSCFTQKRVSISPRKKNISRCKKLPYEVVPGISNDDEDLFFTYINGSTFKTTFVCNFCYNDTFESTQSLRRHVWSAHRSESEQTLYFHMQGPYQTSFQDLN